VFETECAALFLTDRASGALRTAGWFGFDDGFEEACRSSIESLTYLAAGIREGAMLLPVRAEDQPWDALGLARIVFSPFREPGGELRGMLAAGVSRSKQVYFDPVDDDLLPSFTVFTQQMSSLLVNLESESVIRAQIGELTAVNAALEEKTTDLVAARTRLEEMNRDLEHTIRDLSSLHATGMTLSSILDLEHILDTARDAVVRDFGYDRVFLLLVDAGTGILGHGRCEGCTWETAELFRTVTLPLEACDRLFSRAGPALDPVLVRGAQNGPSVHAGNPQASGTLGSGSESWLDPGLVRALGLETYLVVPLEANGKLIGLMIVDNARSGKALTEHDVDLIGTLAGQVSVAIEIADLVERIKESERLSAIGEMAAGIAHEIRNPLSTIGTMVDLLASRDSHVDALLLKGIREESTRLQHILTRFLNYSRPYVPMRVSCDVNIILEEVVSLLQGGDGRGCMKISKELGRLAGPVRIDRDEVKQVLWNLVLNAIEAAGPDGCVTVRSRDDEPGVRIEVVDTGPGIPADDLSRIFKPFFSTKQKGTGLGLPIADKIVRAHGGTLTAESGPGRGAKFVVQLPV
jgi:signal transduction histidine kinase